LQRASGWGKSGIVDGKSVHQAEEDSGHFHTGFIRQSVIFHEFIL
jgi:hypothetical protein